MTFKSSAQRKKVMSTLNRYGSSRGKTARITPDLRVKQTIYVPSTDSTQKEIPSKQLNDRVKEVETFLSKKFGGYTEVKAHGGYTLKNGSLVRENIIEVTAFSKKKDFDTNKHLVFDVLREYAKRWGQESIGYEKNEDFYFIKEKT